MEVRISEIATGFIILFTINAVFFRWVTLDGRYRFVRAELVRDGFLALALGLIFFVGGSPSPLRVLLAVTIVTWFRTKGVYHAYAIALRAASVTMLYFLIRDTLAFFSSNSNVELMTLVILMGISAILVLVKQGLLIMGGQVHIRSRNIKIKILYSCGIAIFGLLYVPTTGYMLGILWVLLGIFHYMLLLLDREKRKSMNLIRRH